ncbi:CHRNA7-FAM7A fusion protein [Mizuhopecten yessoensis]|uniref:CHRNA7-FAM7A fusion protein n=2 Tax=Mizuhopecten yessoensis TaxID=6573 RepID=A0A210Q3Z2_MIZYE|nr:CHRNA7-FAM7A fusion protein [Mizuhopecten yessoensis]
MSGSNLLLRVTSHGLVTWEPPGLYNTHCAVDTTWFPFDVQTCIISVSGWSYNMEDLNVTNKVSHISTNDYRVNGEWLLSRTYISSIPKEGRSHLNLVLQLERRSAFYVMNVLVPVLLTSLLTPMVFKLPSESGERISFILTVVLAIEVLLTVVSAHMPATSLHTSVMELYLVMVLSISALAVILTSLILNLYHREDDMELPKGIRLMLQCHQQLQRRTQVGSAKEETGHAMHKPCNTSNDESSSSDEKHANSNVVEEFDKIGNLKNNKRITCQKLSTHLDDIFFWVFFGLTLLCTLIFMLTMGFGGS